jgi:hypothetical protein
MFVHMNADTGNCAPKKHQQPGTLRVIQLLTADERLAEVAEILALGLIRMSAQKSSPFLPASGEVSLDLNDHQSGPGPNSPQEAEP